MKPNLHFKKSIWLQYDEWTRETRLERPGKIVGEGGPTVVFQVRENVPLSQGWANYGL